MNGQEITMKFGELLEMARQSFEAFTQNTEAALRTQRPMPIAVDEENIDDEKMQLDLAQFAAAPVAAVPRYSEFFPLHENGHRFLLAEDGLYLEVRRPWLHFIHRLADHAAVRIPYGPLKPKCDLAFGSIGTALAQMKEFAAGARNVGPTEAAASVIWNHQSRAWSIAYPETIDASSEHIQFREITAGEHESIVIDLHSHGFGQAFFSGIDDEHDSGSVKIAGVFGNLDQPRPTVAFRLCVLGLYIPINVPAEKIFG